MRADYFIVGGFLRPKVVNVVAWDNGGGLTRDIEVIASALAGRGFVLRFNGRHTRRPERLLLQRLWGRATWELLRLSVFLGVRSPPFHLNLHLEDVSPSFLGMAPSNALIPNPEFFRPTAEAALSHMDLVLTKTREAEAAFTSRGCAVAFVGFASLDRATVPSTESRSGALHLAGGSPLKGTEAVLDAWERHPEWPKLTVVRNSTAYWGESIPWKPRSRRENIAMIESRLPDHEVQRLQSACLFHIAPSEAEGFGHAIVEAMSCGAVVVTTDAPPMNELVTADCGVLVTTRDRTPMGLGWRYAVDPRDLERKLSILFQEGPDRWSALGAAARVRYEEVRSEFESNLYDVAQTLTELR